MWDNFIKNENGNFAIMFSIALFMLVLAISAVIDISRLHNYRTQAQDMADAAVLAAAVSGEQDLDALQLIAQKSVNANNITDSELIATLTILPDNSINVKVSVTAELLMMDIFGHKSTEVSGIAEAPPKGTAPLNLALVLDSTQSMAGTKITSLRSAANDLIDSLEDSEGSVQVSVIPFAIHSRLPRSYDTEPWLEINPSVNTCWMVHDPDNSVNCGPVTYDENENPIHNCEVEVEKEICQLVHYNGCVGSRHAPYHLEADFGSTRIQGYTAGGGACSTEIQPLTTNFTDVRDTITAINTENKTYMPSGLIWGWRSLTREAPMTEANTPDFDDRTSAMILMSDGKNTRSFDSSATNDFMYNGVFHWGDDIDDANAVTTTLCGNIKADNISIYTIAYQVSDPTTINLLRNCASSSSQFYPAGSGPQLQNAFNNIGKKLAQVRLSK